MQVRKSDGNWSVVPVESLKDKSGISRMIGEGGLYSCSITNAYL